MTEKVSMRWVIKLVFASCLAACAEGEQAGTPEAPSPEGERLDLGGLSVVVPEAWERRQPSSSMRKAQFTLPRQDDDVEDGELAVFYFGPRSAGSVTANLDRWQRQMQPEEGSPPATTASRTVDGLRVTVLDAEGAYRAGMGPMMAPGPAKSGYRMVAAIVESPSGAYYFKLTGPVGTVNRWRGLFDRFIDSARAG